MLDRLSPMRPQDVPHVVRSLSLAFGGAPSDVADWLASAGHDNFRVLLDDDRPAASLLRIPMGQFFGGRSVPMLGIAGVCVPPEHRGRSFAKRLMQACVRQAADEGWALSTLYASTHTLYRSVGYERAGQRFACSVSAPYLPAFERAGRIIPADDSHQDAIRSIYSRFASAFNGMIDRGPYIWARVRKFRDRTYQGFLTLDDRGTPDGYLFLSQSRQPDGRFDISLSDLAFTSADAGRRLIGFLSGFGMMLHEVTFHGGASHPALMLLPQQRLRVELRDDWMLRILDVAKALEARGYPPAATGELHFRLVDSLVPRNSGDWILRVENGRGSVVPGGRADLQLTPNGLACIYSGYYTPRQAALAGLVRGAADHFLAAGSPWMTDFF